MVGLGAFGVLQTTGSMAAAEDARRTEAIASALSATVKLGHQLEQEVAETEDLLLRGGTAGEQLLTAQRARTDVAASAYRSSAETAGVAAPAMQELLTEAAAELDDLPAVRYAAQHPGPDKVTPMGPVITDSSRSGSPEGDTPEAAFDDLTHALGDVAVAFAAQPAAPDLSTPARLVAAMTSAEHRAAEERGLLRGVFTRGRFLPGELAELAELRGAEQVNLAEVERLAGPDVRDRYHQLVAGPDVDTTRTIVEDALQADTRPDALTIDPDSWYVASTNALRRQYLFELEIITVMERTASSASAVAETQSLVTGAGTGVVIVLTFASSFAFAVRIGQRLRALRMAALAVASTELPGAIAAVTEAPGAETVRNVVAASMERSQTWLSGEEPDEIGEVATAVGTLHRQALRLAADQALLRLDVAGVFVALSRRGQTLVQRQLALIDEFERSETDPETLSRLFRLDHLAARMRRNEENLLVLAGGESGRSFAYPELLSDVVLAAAAEIEDYARVDASAVPELWVAAHAVSDLVHLLAELLENATVFSPPTARVQVSTHRAVDELTISVFDRGIGMPPGQLAQINERLRHPSRLTSELASRMGLLVVARLAERLQIGVELRSSPGAGTIALVRVPAKLIASAEAVASRRAAEAEARAAAVPPAVSVAPKVQAVGRARPQEADSREALVVTDLPQRDPGGAMQEALRDRSEESAPATLDPELIRARLTSLASGIAAHRERQI
jgi:signal transduction histidine kinase